MVKAAFRNIAATAQDGNNCRNISALWEKQLEKYKDKLTGSPASPLSPVLPGGPGKPWMNKGQTWRKSDARRCFSQCLTSAFLDSGPT